MVVDERRRSELFQAVVQVLGEDQAMTMFALLPPPETDLATRADLERVEGRLNARIDGLEQRLDRVEERLDRLEERLDRLEQRIGGLELGIAGLEHRSDGLRDELLAAFRGELIAAVTSQTRVMVVTVIASVVGLGGLAVTLSQVL